MEKICDLGRGAYGIVEKMRHRQTGTVMAVKRITATVNTQEQVRCVSNGCSLFVKTSFFFPRIESFAYGFGHIDEIECMPIHRSLLRCIVS